MSRVHLTASLLVVGLVCTGCRESGRTGGSGNESEGPVLAAREARFERALEAAAKDSTRNAPVARWILPPELREISGIALMPDGRLLAHGDELARIWTIDPRKGTILTEFSLGPSVTHGDFEGITIADGTIYMLASDGLILEFREGRNGTQVPFTTHDPKLGKECEFEGVAFDRTLMSLVLACKVVKTKSERGDLVLYRWKLPLDPPQLTTLTVPMDLVVGQNGEDRLHPSDITIEPRSGNYVMVAARERALIEITPTGDVVRSQRLPGSHEQAEGVAISPDSLFIVTDEATKRPASITLYRWPIPAAAAASP